MKLFGEMISEKKWVNPKKLWDLKSHPRAIPRTRSENEDPSAMQISSLRIKILLQG